MRRRLGQWGSDNSDWRSARLPFVRSLCQYRKRGALRLCSSSSSMTVRRLKNLRYSISVEEICGRRRLFWEGRGRWRELVGRRASLVAGLMRHLRVWLTPVTVSCDAEELPQVWRNREWRVKKAQAQCDRPSYVADLRDLRPPSASAISMSLHICIANQQPVSTPIDKLYRSLHAL